MRVIVARLREKIGGALIWAGMWFIPELTDGPRIDSRSEPDDDDIPIGDQAVPPVALNDVAREMVLAGMTASPAFRAPDPEAPLKGSARDRILQARRAAGME